MLDTAFAARLSEALGELPGEELLELAETVIADLDTAIADLKKALGETEAAVSALPAFDPAPVPGWAREHIAWIAREHPVNLAAWLDRVAEIDAAPVPERACGETVLLAREQDGKLAIRLFQVFQIEDAKRAALDEDPPGLVTLPATGTEK